MCAGRSTSLESGVVDVEDPRVGTGIATAVREELSLEPAYWQSVIILHGGVFFLQRPSTFYLFIYFFVAKISQRRSVCGHEMKN